MIIAARLFDRDDQIVIDKAGIRWKRWSDQTIPWSEIRKIREGRARRQRFLCIELANPDRYRSTRLVGRLAVLNTALGFNGICLDAVGTDKDYAQLRDAVLAWWPGTLDS